MTNSYTLNDDQPVRIRNHAGEYPETLTAEEFCAVRIAVRRRVTDGAALGGEKEALESAFEKLDKYEVR